MSSNLGHPVHSVFAKILRNRLPNLFQACVYDVKPQLLISKNLKIFVTGTEL